MANDTQKQKPRMDEVFEYFERGRAFTEELMRENERLRLRNVQIEKDLIDARAAAKSLANSQLQEENLNLRQKLEMIESRFLEMEKENHNFVNRYLEVQSQNDSLLSLYVSSYQLHSTLDMNEVVQVIEEIVLNLIGAEQFYICMKDTKTGQPVIMAGEGGDGPLRGRIEQVDPILRATLDRGTSYFRPEGESSPHLACTPLRVKADVVGAISIQKLMSQKAEGLTSIDHELLGLLADHAATALVSSNLYEKVSRKLRTVEGFIELLKNGN